MFPTAAVLAVTSIASVSTTGGERTSDMTSHVPSTGGISFAAIVVSLVAHPLHTRRRRRSPSINTARDPDRASARTFTSRVMLSANTAVDPGFHNGGRPGHNLELAPGILSSSDAIAIVGGVEVDNKAVDISTAKCTETLLPPICKLYSSYLRPLAGVVAVHVRLYDVQGKCYETFIDVIESTICDGPYLANLDLSMTGSNRRRS